MAEYLIQSETLDDIADAINAKTGGSSAMTPAQMVTAIGSISGGTTITDGIVVKSKNASGYPSEIEVYGQLYPYIFGTSRTDSNSYFGFSVLEDVTLKNTVTVIPEGAFEGCGRFGNGITEIVFTDATSIGSFAFALAKIGTLRFPALGTLGNSASVTNIFNGAITDNIYLPNCTSIPQNNTSYGHFRGWTSGVFCQIGSIGYAAPDNVKYQFRDCTQSTLTICIYTHGSYVDSILTTLRTYATGATIVFKASEATEYNNTTYAAGETILTSEVTS